MGKWVGGCVDRRVENGSWLGDEWMVDGWIDGCVEHMNDIACEWVHGWVDERTDE